MAWKLKKIKSRLKITIKTISGGNKEKKKKKSAKIFS